MSAILSGERIGAGGTGASIEVPRSFQPDSDTVLLNSEARLYEFPAASGTFAPSGVSQILIPQHRARYILGGTSYLSFRVQVTANISLGAAGGPLHTKYFPVTFFGGGPTKSAAGLIDRLTISAPNGQVLTDITNYAQWHNLLLTHAANEDYARNSTITENAFTTTTVGETPNNDVSGATVVQTLTSTLDIQLPLAAGLFSEIKAFPLWALNGPLIILIQWNSAVKSIGCGLQVYPLKQSTLPVLLDGEAVTPGTFSLNSSSFAGSELSFRCRCVDVDIDYINQQRMMMMQGKVLTYNYRQTTNLVTKLGATGNVSFNFGLNVSSLLSVFGINMMDNDFGQVATTGVLQLGSGTAVVNSQGYSANEQKNVRIYRDGTQISTFAINNNGRDDAFQPLMEAFGILFSTTNSSVAKRVINCSPDINPTRYFLPNALDSYRTAQTTEHRGSADGAGSTVFSIPPAWQIGSYRGGSVYAPAAYAWGLSTRMCNDAEVANKGSQCSQLQVTIDSGTTLTGNLLVYYVYSCSVSFDGTGNCIVRR